MVLQAKPLHRHEPRSGGAARPNTGGPASDTVLGLTPRVLIVAMVLSAAVLTLLAYVLTE